MYCKWPIVKFERENNGSGINDDGDGEIPFDRLVWIWSSDLKQEESDFLHKLH